MNLQRFDHNGLELVIDTQTGEAYASQSALARMVKVSETAIRKWISSNQIQVRSVEIETGKGLRTSNLLDEGTIYECFAKYKPELLVQCAKAGIRVFLHKLAGYEVTSTAVSPAEHKLPQTFAQALYLAAQLQEEKEKLEQEKKLLEAENKSLEEDNERQAEVIDELFNYSSIIRVAKFNKVSEKAFSWRKLKAASVTMGLEIKQVPCPRFVTKNLYSHDAWRYAYPEYSLPETTTLVIKS